MQSNRPKPFKSNQTVSRRQRSAWLRSLVLISILAIALVVGVVYASAAVYDWARSAARSLPTVRNVAPPSVVLSAPAEKQPQDTDTLALQPVTTDVESSQVTPPEQPVEDRDRITVLLLGVDQRPDDPSPPRTDNMVVITAEPKTGKIGMISLPRDLFVPIPGYDTSGKINTAYFVGEVEHYPGGGGALAKKTVGEFLGYPIDYYVKVNFDGFVQAVDAIGGIDVDVPKTIHDEQYPTIDYGYTTFHIDAGQHHLDGETALMYARTRHADDDFQRARRQQQVLVAIKDQVVKNGLLNPKRALDLLGVLKDSVEHDVSPTELPKLITLASRFQSAEIDQLVLDNHYGQISTNTKFGWILVPDREKIRPAVDKIFAGDTAPSVAEVEALAQQEAQQQADLSRQQVQNDYQAQAEAVRSQLAGEGARVAVLNGTDDPLLAPRAADWLQRQGYQVTTYGQADRTDYPRTVLLTYGDKPFTVASLQDMFAIAKNNIRPGVNAGDANVDLQLIIGRDFYLLVSN